MKRLIYLLLFIGLFGPLSAFSADLPVVLYTDINSGPNRGGENGNGTYLSIFGRNFGSDLSRVRVTINGTAVAAYHFLGTSNGRPDIQQLSVQPGPAVTSGPIQVFVDGVGSNRNRTFTVRSGDIYFVSRSGSDSNGAIGNIDSPFRHVQATVNRSDFGPGDTIVIRGGTWTDIGDYSAFLTITKSGTSTNPLTVMAYPGERVLLDTQGSRGGINFYNSSGGVVVSGLHIDGNTHDTFQMQNKTNNMRVVNNEMFGLWGTSGGSAGITGNGKNVEILGNAVHDIGAMKLFHGIYIDNDGGDGADNYDVAYNHIYNITGGRGIQVFWFNPSLTNIRIYGNLIHDTDRDGIILSDNSGTGFLIYNNVIYRTGRVTGSGIHLNSSSVSAAIYNNTLYDADVADTSGAINIEAASHADVHNNIVYARSGFAYLDNSVSASRLSISHNLWYGAGSPPALDSAPISGNPQFINLTERNFALQNSSPAIDQGLSYGSLTLDYDGAMRPLDGNGDSLSNTDCGAYEYRNKVTPIAPGRPGKPVLTVGP